ncbi:MAG: hypothetical protein ACE5K9_09640 [Candidatus Methylomirabilales bacterium]
MAELHQTLQGAKVRDDIYILRKLHDGNEDVVISPAQAPAQEIKEQPPSSSAGRVSASPAEGSRLPTHKPEPQSRKQKTQDLMTYSFPTPPSAGPDDLRSLIRWFLNHDRLIPNNLEILEEAHRILYGVEHGLTYERHLASSIADDLRTYNSRDLMQEHLILLTTVYARTLQDLLTLGSHEQNLQSPTDLPQPERQKMWELCLRFGLTATRLRVEGWIYQLHHGEPPSVKKPPTKRR